MRGAHFLPTSNGMVKRTEPLACPSPFFISCWIKNLKIRHSSLFWSPLYQISQSSSFRCFRYSDVRFKISTVHSLSNKITLHLLGCFSTKTGCGWRFKENRKRPDSNRNYPVSTKSDSNSCQANTKTQPTGPWRSQSWHCRQKGNAVEITNQAKYQTCTNLPFQNVYLHYADSPKNEYAAKL